jgi:hypothetical protein
VDDMADSHYVIIVLVYIMQTPSIALQYANKKMSHELLYAPSKRAEQLYFIM